MMKKSSRLSKTRAPDERRHLEDVTCSIREYMGGSDWLDVSRKLQPIPGFFTIPMLHFLGGGEALKAQAFFD